MLTLNKIQSTELLYEGFYVTIQPQKQKETKELNIQIDFSINSEKQKKPEIIKSIIHFIFPELEKIQSIESCLQTKPSTHSFISTNENGLRFYYFITRWFVKNSVKLIILVSGRFSYLYYSLLEYLKTIPIDKSILILQRLKSSQFPNESGNTYIFPVYNNETIIIQRKKIILNLLNMMGVSDFVELIGRILLEENTLFLIDKYSDGMDIIESILKLLEPFEWQGVLIPILPIEDSYIGFAGCPTPILFSTTKEGYKKIKLFYSDSLDINIYDCTSNKFIQKRKGLNLFVFNEVGRLLNQLEYVKQHQNDYQNIDTVISNCFGQLYLDLFGRYFAFFEEREIKGIIGKKELSFNQDRFIKVSPVDLQIFLTAFNQSQMFERFIQQRIDYIEKKPDFRRTIFADCPLFRMVQDKVQFTKMKDISNTPKECVGCGKLIEKERGVTIYGNYLLYHSECLRCKSCDCYLIGKESFDRQCQHCIDEDKEIIQNQYDNSLRWEQADITIKKNKMISNDLTKANHFSKLKAKLSFCELTPNELSENDKRKLEKELRHTSVFFNSQTGSIHSENSSLIGTITAVFDPNDSKKSIVTQNPIDPMSLLQSFNMSGKINLNDTTYDYKRNEINLKEEYSKLKQEQKNDLELEIKKQQQEQLNLMENINENYMNECDNKNGNNCDNLLQSTCPKKEMNSNKTKSNEKTEIKIEKQNEIPMIFEDYEQMNQNQLLSSTSLLQTGRYNSNSENKECIPNEKK